MKKEILNIIFIGADPSSGKIQHPGGQLTASIGLIQYALKNNINLHIIDTCQSSFPPPPISNRIRKGVNRVFELINLLKNREINGVIIFCGSGLSFFEKSFMAIICRIMKAKCLLFIRSGHFMNDVKSSKFVRLLFSTILRIPNYLGAQGTPWQDFYISMGIPRKRIVVVRNWLMEKIAPKNKIVFKTERVRFVFVGWLVKEKGIRELMQAFTDSKKLRENAELFIAGDGTLREYVDKIVIQEQLDNVKILGWLGRNGINEILTEGHVFVLPSYAEGFPNALLEALSYGLAIISTPVGAITDSAIDGFNAIIIPPRDANSLQLAMELFIENKSLVSNYSAHSLDIVEKQHNQTINCKNLFETFR